MKKSFLTGLALLLPVILTIAIVIFIINLLTAPFVGAVEAAFKHYGILNKPLLFFSSEQILVFSSKIIILITLVVSIVLVGFLGQVFIINHLGKFGDYLIHRIPIVNTIYKAIQDVVMTLFVKKPKQKMDFSSVVLVPFPHSKTYTVALITNSHNVLESNTLDSDSVSVFVPGTPNPAMGFMLIFRRDQIIPINMSVEDALKFVVSIGVICPAFSGFPTRISQQDLAAK